MIEPIDRDQQREVLDLTQHYVDRAARAYDRRFAAVPVLFDLSGSSAGLFRVHGREHCIRYNPWLFAKYYPENLEGTVPHEVAHYITHALYGLHRVRPHGAEWLEVMNFFGADTTVTCDFDLDGIPLRKERRFPYQCGCQVHQLTTRRHNAIRRGKGRYECVLCKLELRPIIGP
jgi:SprT protein